MVIIPAGEFKMGAPDGEIGCRKGMTANEMVRPCSGPASDRSWLGAAKTRSTPCLRNPTAQSP
jgi:hypothetical protein